jgi:hypothetical protein
MYLLEFVNLVRRAQGYEAIDRLPAEEAGASALELAMGCRLEAGLMRLGGAQQASAVAAASGLPVGADPSTVVLPVALDPHATALGAARAAHGRPLGLAGVP